MVLVLSMPRDVRSADVDRTQLNHILAVLRTVPGEASAACLSSMRDVHRLERGADPSPQNLEFSYQNASQLCGADAERACHEDAARVDREACRVLDAPR